MTDLAVLSLFLSLEVKKIQMFYDPLTLSYASIWWQVKELQHIFRNTYCRVLVLTDRIWSEAEERVRVMTVGCTLVPCFNR